MKNLSKTFCFSSAHATWIVPIQIIAVLTLVISNITAVYQSGVKRILAYSSIGHVGYILLAFVSNDAAATGTIFYYLTAYSVASITAFTILHAFESSNQIITVEYFNGLFKRNPLLAIGMTLALLSLAGIPPLPGFFGKYMVFALAIENGFTGLVILAILTSLIGVYYYFRLIIAMFLKEPSEKDITISGSMRILIFVLIAITIGLGIFPDFVIGVIR